MADSDESTVGYELEAEPTPPPLPGDVVVRNDAHDTITAACADLMLHAANCVRSFGDFHLALSGGSTPLPMYMRLMVDPLYRGFPWSRTHLWIVDERCVPLDHDSSNYRHIAEILGDHSDIPKANLHPIRADQPGAAEAYERELRQTLAWREKGQDRLDYALLGMGGDGHTASLFPHSPALEATDCLVVENDGPTVTPPPRITMTYTLLNATRFIGVLALGSGKADRLKMLMPDGVAASAQENPILGIAPIGGTLRWYLDGDACGPVSP